MTDKEKFRKEVEKLKSNLMYGACSSQIAMETMCKEEAYNEVLAILDTMQEEPVSEDLEEAIDTYLKSYWGGEKEKQEWPFLKKMAIYFAQWKKEQMMTKAKSGTVQKDNQVILDNGTYIDLDPSMQLKPSFVGLKEGDRIKVIIIKEG